MKFENPYWSNTIKISLLQRWIIVHSILYYERNQSVVSDKKFDENAKQLVQMQHDFPDEASQSEYWYMFSDFDGSTGFDLYDRLKQKDKKHLNKIAQFVLNQAASGGSKHGKKR